MGLCNLRYVDEEIAKRKAVVERYRERLNGVDGIQLNCVQDDVKSNYAYFPVVFEERLFGASRAEVFDKLAENGIGARKYFYPLTNTFECFHGKYDVTKTPVALHISKRVLTLKEKLQQRTEAFLGYDRLRTGWIYEQGKTEKNLNRYILRMQQIEEQENRCCVQYTDHKIQVMSAWEDEVGKLKDTYL